MEPVGWQFFGQKVPTYGHLLPTKLGSAHTTRDSRPAKETRAVIGYDDVLPLLSGACASYADSDEAARHDDRNGHYVNIGLFVSHLIRLLEDGNVDHFAEVFDVAERLLSEGDEEARRLLSDGFLHDLTSSELFVASPVEPRDFLPWLGRQTRRDQHVQRLVG
jgi:hypothetical protein